MNIKPDFDKRIELVFGLLYCAYIDGIIPENYGKYFFFKSCNNDYYQNFYNMYKKYASLELKEYIKNGGFDYYERTLQIALAMDYEYNIQDNQYIEQIKINNKSFDQKKANFLLKDFTTKANYEKFYNDNANYYNALCNKFTKALNAYVNFNSNILTDFFGYSVGEFGIKIFNFVSGSFGYINENTILSCISINAELVNILNAKAINENFAVFYKNKIVPYFIQLNNKL